MMSCAGAGHGQQQGRHHAPPHLHHGTEGHNAEEHLKTRKKAVKPQWLTGCS